MQSITAKRMIAGLVMTVRKGGRMVIRRRYLGDFRGGKVKFF